MKADTELIEYIKKRYEKMIGIGKEIIEDQELSSICFFAGKSAAFNEILKILEEK